MAYEWSSNKFYAGLGFDAFMGPDGSFQYSSNIDTRRNPRGFQLVPKVAKYDYGSIKITAMTSVNASNLFTFSSAGRVYKNHSLAYTLSGAVTSKEILNACIFKDYLYIFTASWVHRIKVVDAIAWSWGSITENFINYSVVAYTQPLDAWFTTAVLDFKNSWWVVTNFILLDRDWNTVSWSSLSTISSWYTEVTWWPFANGPFTATYDFVPDVGTVMPILNYYDSTLYVALKSIVLWYKPQLSANPDPTLMIQFEDSQNIVGITAHDTQFCIYVQIDSQSSRKYFWDGTSKEPSAIMERSWIVIQNVWVMGNYDVVVTNEPRNEISSAYKTQWYDKVLLYEWKKINGSVLNWEFHCLAMNQDLPIKKEVAFIGAEQWIYSIWAYYPWFAPSTARERQPATQLRPWCWCVHNSYLYIAYQDVWASTYYITEIDLNYEPTLSATSQEASGTLIQRVHTGERVADYKTITSIEIWYGFEGTKSANAWNPYIEFYIRCNLRWTNWLLLRTIDARTGTDVVNNRVIIDPAEINAALITAGETKSFVDFNMLEWKAILYAWSNPLCKPVVYEVNVLYDIIKPNYARW